MPELTPEERDAAEHGVISMLAEDGPQYWNRSETIPGHRAEFHFDQDTMWMKIVCENAPDSGALCRVTEGQRYTFTNEDGYGDSMGKHAESVCLAEAYYALDPGLTPELHDGAGTNEFGIASRPAEVRWDGDDWVWDIVHPDQDEVFKAARAVLTEFADRRRHLGASVETPFERRMFDALSALNERLDL